MKITGKDVENVALLARLEVSPDQIDQFSSQLSAVLEYAENLSKVDTEHVAPLAHVLSIQNVMRADVVSPSLPRAAAQQNAPEADNGYFKVPKVVEG